MFIAAIVLSFAASFGPWLLRQMDLTPLNTDLHQWVPRSH